jgi:hypothetical protein
VAPHARRPSHASRAVDFLHGLQPAAAAAYSVGLLAGGRLAAGKNGRRVLAAAFFISASPHFCIAVSS